MRIFSTLAVVGILLVYSDYTQVSLKIGPENYRPSLFGFSLFVDFVPQGGRASVDGRKSAKAPTANAHKKATITKKHAGPIESEEMKKWEV